MISKLSLSERLALGVVLFTALPYFLSIVFSVVIHRDIMDCLEQAGYTSFCWQKFKIFYWGFFVFWLIAIIGSGLSVFYFLRRIIKPVQDLTRIATNIALDKPMEILAPFKKDEISALYEAAANMKRHLEEKIHELNKDNQSKSEFLAVALHQLRTPLSAMKWLLELLKENHDLSDAGKEKLDEVYKSNERLINLVNDLLSVSRMERGRLIATPRIFNFLDIINDSLNMIRPESEKKNQKINLTIETETKEANLDPILFLEAFRNVLENAVFYAPENSDIEIAVNIDHNQLIVSIHNDGPVIGATEREKLFTKFYRGYVGARLRPTGSGLGLFIAKAAIEANGGKIWFESPGPEGDGVTFYISVPIA